MTDAWLNVLQFLGLAWWVEVKTDDCTYYFGPFAARSDAADAQGGYVEDLEQEGASNIEVNLMKGKPNQLTVEDQPLKSSGKPVLI